MTSKAFIFDMDGVLVNSEELWIETEYAFIRQFVPSFREEDQKHFPGKSLIDIYYFLQKNYHLDVDADIFLRTFEQFGIEHIYSRAKLSSGVKNFLKKITKNKKILASSAPHIWINKVLDDFDLREDFPSGVSAEDIDGPGKPAPGIFLEAARQLEESSKNCIVIEDSTAGVLAGKAASMEVWGYRNGYNDHQDLSEADRIFDDFFAL